jgi:hypothetical protein
MQELLVEALHGRRPAIKSRWADLLRIERANTPLAHADTLVHLLDETLDKVLAALRSHPFAGEPSSLSDVGSRAQCDCGRNPFLQFYVAGERALLEALVLAQADLHLREPKTRDLAVLELYLVVRHFARSDVGVFCSVCQYHQSPSPEPVLAQVG